MRGQPILALLGATATGKTALAASVAEELGAEIVCADSRQVFADLDLGTGKPPAAERRERPHHLFGALSLEESPSAGWYARAATAAIHDIRGRGRVPLLVGGAGLYLRALRDGLAPEPELEPQARAQLRRVHAAAAVSDLWARLARLDPDGAARLHRHDRQRIGRALEVVELSGRPLGWWHAQPVKPPVAGEWRVLELSVAAARLSHWIENRTAWMFANGLVEETRSLIERGFEPALRRLRAVGYDEARDLIAGRMTRLEAEARTTQRTRQLAKRQRTWFRHQIEAEVLDGDMGGRRLRSLVLGCYRRE